MIHMKRILIIGSDSYIAQHLIKRMVNQYTVVGLARNIANTEYEILLDDFWNIPVDYFRETDVVVNFAAIVHQPKADKSLYTDINYKLIVHNARIAKENNVPLFIQLSTVSVYGYAHRIDKNTPELPVNNYGKSKLFADRELQNMEEEGFAIAIVRPAMVYGGGGAPGNMMRLIRLVSRGFPLPLKNAVAKRHYLNLNILIDILKRIIEMNSGGIFLLADENGISTHELVNLISSSLNKKVIQFGFPGFLLTLVKKLWPGMYYKLYSPLFIDSSDTFNYFNYNPKDQIHSGIKSMTDYFRNN